MSTKKLRSSLRFRLIAIDCVVSLGKKLYPTLSLFIHGCLVLAIYYSVHVHPTPGGVGILPVLHNATEIRFTSSCVGYTWLCMTLPADTMYNSSFIFFGFLWKNYIMSTMYKLFVPEYNNNCTCNIGKD